MIVLWHKIKAYVAGAVAFIACPCHLPLTLPLLISLTASTAFGAWLAQNTVLVGVISTIIFIAGWRWPSNGSRNLPVQRGQSPTQRRLCPKPSR
jgi:hypothetical protein